MSPQGEEETHSLEGLRQCLHSVDGILQDLLEETTKNQSSPMQIPNYSSRLSELESQKAEILSELERMKLEKESFQESLKSPIKEDYHFLVSDRVELQSKLGDLNLRLNELESLLEDKNHEIVAKDVERQEFMERFQRYETEKINVLRQVLVLENELENCRAELQSRSDEKNKAIDEYCDINDILRALREGKKVVETKLSKVIEEKNQGLVEIEYLKEQIQGLQSSLTEKDTQLVEKVSFYENQMSEMQVEMNARLEEMNVTNEETKESIRSRYLNLFEEKVQELFNLRSNYEDSVLKLESSERKRLELELELRDLQSQFTSKNEVNSGKILLLEKDLQFVKGQFESLKEACRISVDQLRDRLRDMRTELDIKNHELQQLKSESSSPSLAPSQKNKKYNSSHKSHNGSRS